MNAGWPFADFQRVTDFDLRNEWNSEMDQLAERGWALRNEEKFQLTHQGLRFADARRKCFCDEISLTSPDFLKRPIKMQLCSK